MTTLKFKSDAEFEKWRRSLPDKPRLRVAASLGERVVVDDVQAVVPSPRPRRRRLPSRAAVARAWAWACLCWAVAAGGMLGAAFCLGALSQIH